MEFPVGMPWIFGDSPSIDLEDLDEDASARLSYERQVDACAAGLALLLGQFDDAGEGAPRRAPRLRAIACALLDGVGDVENAIWAMFTERWLDTAVGAQLDELGTVVRWPRGGRTDETYRAFLEGKILANRSSGRWWELLAIVAVLGFDPAAVTYTPDPPAAFYVTIADYLEDVPGGDVFALLEIAKLGGVRLLLEYPGAPLAESFTLSATSARVVDTSLGFGSTVDPAVGGRWSGVRASSAEV